MSDLPHFDDPNLENYCSFLSSTPNEEYSQQILQETFAADQAQINPKEHSREEGSELPKTSQVKMSERHKQLLAEKVTALEGSTVGEGSSSKKLAHNAKERIRRMRLNASYLALRALLPDSKRSKKRWTSPAIVDRVLKYIPELENEIENLKHTKDKAKNKQEQQQRLLNQESNNLTISINEVKNDEAILQICKEQHHDNEVFSRFLEHMETEQVCIKTASTLSICDNRICYQLHIQWNTSELGEDYTRKLRDKVICWFR